MGQREVPNDLSPVVDAGEATLLRAIPLTIASFSRSDK